MNQLRVVVIGAGIMGLSAAWALTRRGADVTVVEQGPVPNPLASSVDRHRLIRYPYGDHDAYALMVRDAYGAWERLWADLGERLQIETGTLAFDSQDGADWASRSRSSMERLKIPFERLGQSEIARRFPMLDPDGIGEAIYLETGGILMAERIVAALAQRLTQRRPEMIRAHTQVTAIDPNDGSVRLADGSELGADAVVVAAGPWIGRLAPSLKRRVTPSRQVVVYLDPPAPLAGAWEGAPMILAIDPDLGFYAVPPAGGLGLKVGDHRFSLSGEPDLERAPTPAEAAEIAGLCRNRFRGFDGYRIAEARTCFYDVEPGERFILEPLGDRGWVMSGFSGHGFKFGALLGEKLADTIFGQSVPIQLSTWAAGLNH